MGYFQSAKAMYEADYSGYNDLYTGEGGAFYNLIFPAYIRFSYLTQIADEINKKTNMTDSLANGYSEFVEKRADELGLTRKQATYAEIPVKFIGTANETISQGFVVGTLDNRLYFTTTDIVLNDNGEGIGIVRAEIAGSKYNVNVNEITYIPIKTKNVVSVTNESEYFDAYDKETDESLADRYYEVLRNNKTSGNIAHYKYWALNVQGCGYCKVVPLWDKSNGKDGAGTVKLIIANSNKRKANDELIEKVKKYIADSDDGSGMAPIGCDLTVVSFNEKQIDINVDLLLDDGYKLDDIKLSLEKNIQEYLTNLNIDVKKIRLFDIMKVISNVNGVIDMDNLKLNNSESNIDLDDEDIPIIGALNVGEITI